MKRRNCCFECGCNFKLTEKDKNLSVSVEYGYPEGLDDVYSVCKKCADEIRIKFYPNKFKV